jgi:hypothetical protein
VLRADQQALSTYFAGGWKEAEPPPFRFVPLGAAPCLEGSLAAIGCVAEQLIDGGDHWIVIGAVRDLHGALAAAPLPFRWPLSLIDFSAGAQAPDLASVSDEPEHLHCNADR